MSLNKRTDCVSLTVFLFNKNEYLFRRSHTLFVCALFILFLFYFLFETRQFLNAYSIAAQTLSRVDDLAGILRLCFVLLSFPVENAPSFDQTGFDIVPIAARRCDREHKKAVGWDTQSIDLLIVSSCNSDLLTPP